MGYKPVGFGVLPQARVGRFSPVTHPWPLTSPGTSWLSRPCHHWPPALPGIPIPSSSWSKHSSTATGRGHGDPSLAPGVQGGPALVRDSSAPGRGGGVRGGGGLGRAGEQRCATEGPLFLPQVCGVLQPVLAALSSPVSMALKPHVMSCVWSQPDLRLGGKLGAFCETSC